MNEEMTKDEWIEQAMTLLFVLADYYPSHFTHSDAVFAKVQKLQTARFKEN